MTTEEGVVADPMSSPNDSINNLDLGSLIKGILINYFLFCLFINN